MQMLSKANWLKGAVVTLGSAALAGVGALAYARYLELVRIDVTALSLALRRLAPEFDGYRIVQLSDLHLDGVMTRGRLAQIVALANAQSPDLVVVTGDFVSQGIGFNADDLCIPLSELTACDAKVAVMGNHDQREHTMMVRRVIAESGLIDLNNAVCTLHRGAASLHIAGVDSMYRQRARLDLVMNQLPEDGAAVLLAHEPDFADVSAATGRFDLQLSGHSHGGQVRIPALLRWGLPHYGARYVIGLHLVGDMLLYINRGLGMTSLPIRFNCRPEITVITLRQAQVS
jgi:predicted MPP superfamily phosphohydrolase